MLHPWTSERAISSRAFDEHEPSGLGRNLNSITFSMSAFQIRRVEGLAREMTATSARVVEVRARLSGRRKVGRTLVSSERRAKLC